MGVVPGPSTLGNSKTVPGVTSHQTHGGWCLHCVACCPFLLSSQVLQSARRRPERKVTATALTTQSITRQERDQTSVQSNCLEVTCSTDILHEHWEAHRGAHQEHHICEGMRHALLLSILPQEPNPQPKIIVFREGLCRNLYWNTDVTELAYLWDPRI